TPGPGARFAIRIRNPVGIPADGGRLADVPGRDGLDPGSRTWRSHGRVTVRDDGWRCFEVYVLPSRSDCGSAVPRESHVDTGEDYYEHDKYSSLAGGASGAEPERGD